MKHHIFFSFVTLFAIASGVFVPPRSGHKKHHLLGAKECTWGPSYWCQNLTAAADCHAVPHCIQTVWIHKKLPPDTSSICQTCLDMVRQARDQLESNETQELIKEVFEGSCKLLHIKPVVKECDKIADNYIPELIDTLASQMNPQVVCSVAGLCNSEKIHQLLRESGEKIEVTKSTTEVAALNTCEGCHTVVELIESKFNKMSRDDLLHSFLRICGKMGSFSDGCSNIVITYFNDIYRHLQEHLNAEEVCLFSGDCSAQFHKHANVEITPMSHVGYVQPAVTKDDLPCQLCEQLVAHLRDLLIANTTEEEFKKVLEGLCKQSGKFSQECSSLVDQYYELIYSYLTHNLNGSEVCLAIGICPGQQEDYFFAPLLPVSTAKMAQKLKDDPEMARIPLQKETVKVVPPGTEQDIIPEQQIPIEAVVPPHMQVLYNKEVCEFCQYFLHYMQNALVDPKTEDKIKSVLEEACDHLPSVVNETCQGFVDTYEPALIAILVQDIDPSQVCPLIRACPSSKNAEVEIFMQAKGDSRCPLCLFAVTKLEDMVKDQKTEENIEKALNKICDHLPESTVDECKDFVKTYSKELIELLMADLKPDEVCVYLKMCSDEKPAPKLPPYVFRHIGGDVETNIIPDNTINGHFFDPKDVEIIEDSPQCVMCEFIMKEIEDQLKDNDQHIEQIVKNICNVMPHSVKDKCNDFVDKYADTIIQLLIQALEPSEICTMMKLCNSHMNDMKVQILDCPICEMTVEAMEKVLGNPKVDHDIEHILEKTCRGLPQRYRNKCSNFIEENGDQMIDMLVHYTDKKAICRKLGYCKSNLGVIVID